MEPRLILEQSQKLIMTPELKQAITVLTLPALELTDYIQQQLEDNPVLELPDSIEAAPEMPKSEEANSDLKELFDDRSDLGIGTRVPREQRETTFEPVAVQNPSLQDHLRFQLHIARLSDMQERIGEYIIDCITHDGYLKVTDDEMARTMRILPEQVAEVLAIIRTFDPAGIGGRNLAECLTLQLDPNDPNTPVLARMIQDHLDDIACNRMAVIAKDLKLAIKDVQELVDQIKTLNPKPGLQYSADNSVDYIMPDVVIERVGGEYVVLVNDTTVPRLNISSYYRSLVHQDGIPEDNVRKFIEGKLNSAIWLIKSIEQRRMTLYKVATTVVEYQRDFLDQGISHLVPLNLKEVADKIGVHESTVSRAISNKYVQTPRGTFPWKFFFASGLVNAEGDSKSANWVKRIIQDLVAAENEKQPLSDQKLTDILEEKGISISRRTVAKYREDLNIASSSKRKRY